MFTGRKVEETKEDFERRIGFKSEAKKIVIKHKGTLKEWLFTCAQSEWEIIIVIYRDGNWENFNRNDEFLRVYAIRVRQILGRMNGKKKNWPNVLKEIENEVSDYYAKNW